MSDTCPRCGIGRVVPIVWGLVKDGDLLERERRGELVLGGCFKGPDTHRCLACDTSFVLEGATLAAGEVDVCRSALFVTGEVARVVRHLETGGRGAFVSGGAGAWQGPWVAVVLESDDATHQVALELSRALNTVSLVMESGSRSILLRAWRLGEPIVELGRPSQATVRRNSSGIRQILLRGGDPRQVERLFDDGLSGACGDELFDELAGLLKVPDTARFNQLAHYLTFRRVGKPSE
jgi:hypothetical protein